MSDEQKQTLDKAIGVAAVLAPLALVISKVSSTVSNVTQVCKDLRPVILLLNNAIAANPIVLVITAIVALIAILVTMYNKCEWFRNGVNDIFGNIQEFVSGAIENIKTFLDT